MDVQMKNNVEVMDSAKSMYLMVRMLKDQNIYGKIDKTFCDFRKLKEKMQHVWRIKYSTLVNMKY